MSSFEVAIRAFILVELIEIMWWSVALFNHSANMRAGALPECCDKVKYQFSQHHWFRIAFAAMNNIFYFFICGLWFILSFYHEPRYYTFYIVAGVLLTNVHFVAIIARCADLDVKCWPIVSRHIRYAGRMYFKNDL